VGLGWQTFDLTGDAGTLGAVIFVFGISLVTFGPHPIGTLWLGLLAEALDIRAAFLIAGLVLMVYIAMLDVWSSDLPWLTQPPLSLLRLEMSLPCRARRFVFRLSFGRD
jgi:hypothetical protein